MHFDLADHYQARSSLIHQLDARVKVIVTVATVLALSLLPEGSWWGFAAIGFFILAVILIARLELRFVWSRSIIALPFVLAAVVLPFTIPGPELGRLPLLGWTVTRPGWIRFVSILLRSWLAVQMAILLTSTSRFDQILWALAKLGLPKTLVATLGFMYRYLFLLGDEALRLLRARSARSAQGLSANKVSLLWQGQVAGHMVGSLFLRSLERSERVYAAMLARGYDGQARMMQTTVLRKVDWWVMMGGLSFLLGVVLVTMGG